VFPGVRQEAGGRRDARPPRTAAVTYLTAMADPLTAMPGEDERFEPGLDILVRGLAAYAQPAPATNRR
jgi:hypothetical protein